MSLIAELSLSGGTIHFDETFENAPEARCVFEDFHYLDDDEGTFYVIFCWMSGTQTDEFEDALEDDPTIAGFAEVAEVLDKHLYRVKTKSFPPEQPLVFPLYRRKNITEMESIRDAEGLHLKARFPTRETLRGFVESGRQIAEDVDVRSIYVEREAPGTEEGPDPTLTPKQRDALSVALEMGYFDTPSQATLGDVAEEFGVTPQTVSTHIRVGVRKLLEDQVSSESEN